MSPAIDFESIDRLPFERQAYAALDALSEAWDRGEGEAAVREARAYGITVEAMRRELGVPAATIREILGQE